MKNKLTAALITFVAMIGIVGVTQTANVHAVIVPGNNGTLKVHEAGTPSGTESNDPKVCSFNLEGFGLDPGQTGTISFDVQGGDGPTGVPAGPFDFGPANGDGYYATQYFSLQDGHYKATLYGKDVGSEDESQPTEKAKSKVFKVDCEPDEEKTPGVAVSLVCPVNTYTLTVANTGETELAVEINGQSTTLPAGSAAITANFNVGDVLSVSVDGSPVMVEGKVLDNFTLRTCQGMGSTSTNSSTPTPTGGGISTGFGAGAATNVESLPVTSGGGAQLATLILLLGSAFATAVTYVARARTGFSL